MDKLKYILFTLTLLLLSGCWMDTDIGLIPLAENDTDFGLWEFASYLNMSVLQPKNFEDNKTVRVYDLIVESPNSIIIGGIQNGTPFATISAQEISSISRNISRKFVTTERDFIIFNDYNGTAYLVSGNQNLDPNASSFVSASDPEGNGMLISKYNLFHDEPYSGQLVNLFGDMDMITKKNNTGSLLNDTKNNSIRIGFYDDFISGDEISVFGYEGLDYKMTITQERINSFDPHYFGEYTIFNESYIWNSNPASRTSPSTPAAGELNLFARDDGNLYIKRSDGNVRRITTANTGSNIWDQENIFNNHTTFTGDVILNNTVYNGGSVGFACIDGVGRLFKSVDPCDVTTDTWVQSNISDPNLGKEVDN